MTREQASSIIAASRRFQVSSGRIVVRDSELANMIETVKAERRPILTHTRSAFISG